ncbi:MULTISPECIES: hypothetical protein [Listeria]|uniref:hypothetical protein n=2 Tax=Listeria TaxID=1637 RepID=UPI000B58E3E2|nr:MULTISPECIES: hypothetical protein [Listeria]
MTTFRKITVEGQKFLWKYSFDDYDYQNDSSLIIKSADTNGKLLIYFRTGKWDSGYCPFNKGVPALYQGQRITINLNQPRFIAEIIAYVREQLDLKLLLGTVELDNGIELLRDIGYVFDYQKQ